MRTPVRLLHAERGGECEMETMTQKATAPAEETTFAVSLALADGYRFEADFGVPGAAPFVLDEPPPLGEGAGPNPARLLATAVANCLASSLLFCLRKAHVEVTGMTVAAQGRMTRNERGRLRVTGIEVTLSPHIAAADEARIGRCLEIFEDYCPVTGAVRAGLDVRVAVTPVSR
jgi:organic hydroperoxide reductase OsmC/OhrA